MQISETTIRNVLTRTSGYLKTVTSHSLQPYRGCSFGGALCGVGCYVQHNGHVTRGREWGSFLEVRTNAAQSYADNYDREARWARKHRSRFSIFLSSATDPFVPQEFCYGITRAVLEAMLKQPPDLLILQTHSHRVAEYLPLLTRLNDVCKLRVHLTIETDRERIPGLPPHCSPIAKRFEACAELKAAGLWTVVAVSPLLPIAAPHEFFAKVAAVADAVILDHFIEGDGTATGQRTQRTALPDAMAAIDPCSVTLEYRSKMSRIAADYLPGRVGVNIDGFAGRFQ